MRILAELPRDQGGYSWTSGQELEAATHLSPPEINDAVAILNEWDLVEIQRWFGTAPFQFGQVSITSRGRYERQRVEIADKLQEAETLLDQSLTVRPPTPVGSPFGFTDTDWETVSDARSRTNELRIVLGHQWESQHFNNEQLRGNVRDMFQKALAAYSQSQRAIQGVTLVFRALGAGYGEHLFNEIARDIISADIAVFEMSDLNPNVMIELGVALTWGVAVLPIKNEGCPRSPSDISGQTWADYRENGSVFIDPRHSEKLTSMVERAVRKKLARTR